MGTLVSRIYAISRLCLGTKIYSFISEEAKTRGICENQREDHRLLQNHASPAEATCMMGRSSKHMNYEQEKVSKFEWVRILEEEPEITRLYKELFSEEDPWVQITEIEPGLYLGGIPDPGSDKLGVQSMNSNKAPHYFVNQLNIKTLISFSDYPVTWNHGDNIDYVHYVVHDSEDIKISELFEDVILRIKEARDKNHNVFIHCHMGYSRSVTSLCAYYLVHGIPGNKTPLLVDVIAFIQSKRPFIRPNIGFFIQLLDLERKLIQERE